MAEYAKQWLPLEKQVDRLIARGLEVDSRARAISVLEAIGYYRLTGYLYPFLESEEYTDDQDRVRTRVLGKYLPGTALQHAESVIEFDRQLRLLVMEVLSALKSRCGCGLATF